MSGCRHEWHDYHRLSFPCPDCGTWADEGNSSATDYHELPEVPRCCGTCSYLEQIWIPIDTGYRFASWKCDELDIRVTPHGLCSHWERRDDGG